MHAASTNLKVIIAIATSLFLETALASIAGAAKVGVDAIVVEPTTPAPSAICRLKVRVKNSGAQAVSFLKFGVTIDGKDVPVYKAQSYAINIEAGTTDEIDLYNFYSPSESKTFEVKVTLVEAQWVQVKKEGKTTTTTPSGPVEGLPASSTLSLKMSSRK
jgi:hypothetical protein